MLPAAERMRGAFRRLIRGQSNDTLPLGEGSRATNGSSSIDGFTLVHGLRPEQVAALQRAAEASGTLIIVTPKGETGSNGRRTSRYDVAIRLDPHGTFSTDLHFPRNNGSSGEA